MISSLFSHTRNPVEDALDIEVLSPHVDADQFQKVYHHALSGKDRKFFAAPPLTEHANGQQPEWLRLSTEIDKQCWFGAINREGELVGITLAMRWPEEPTGRTALFRFSYVLPDWRNHNILRQLSRARFEWAKSQRNPAIDKVTLFHRRGHWIEHLVKEQSGQEIFTSPTQWADGTIDDAIWYAVPLKQNQIPNITRAS